MLIIYRESISRTFKKSNLTKAVRKKDKEKK